MLCVLMLRLDLAHVREHAGQRGLVKQHRHDVGRPVQWFGHLCLGVCVEAHLARTTQKPNQSPLFRAVGVLYRRMSSLHSIMNGLSERVRVLEDALNAKQMLQAGAGARVSLEKDASSDSDSDPYAHLSSSESGSDSDA